MSMAIASHNSMACFLDADVKTCVNSWEQGGNSVQLPPTKGHDKGSPSKQSSQLRAYSATFF